MDKLVDYFFSGDESGLDEKTRKVIARTNLIHSTTLEIELEMNRQGISRTDLAKRLGKSKSNISAMLDGDRNMTLGTLSSICYELGVTPSIRIASDPAKLSSQTASRLSSATVEYTTEFLSGPNDEASFSVSAVSNSLITSSQNTNG